MTIDMFTCFREIYGMNLIFVYYLIFRGVIIGVGGILFGREFVLVSRGAYIRGAYIRGAYIRDFTVF